MLNMSIWMPYRRILVRATNWVGDAVMSLPALHALRLRFPQSHISVLARPWVADLYDGESFCDELIPYTAPRGWSGLRAKRDLASVLRDRHFDCAILFQNAFEAAALVYWARIPERIGYDRDGRGFMLTRSVRVPSSAEIPRHQRFYYLELLKRSGMIEQYSDHVEASLARSKAAGRGRSLFEANNITGPVIGVSPGAAFGGAKRWLPERFAESAVSLGKRLEATVALFGSSEEAALTAELAEHIKREGARAVNFGGKTSLRDFIDLAAACEVFLTNDSGSMHIASALGVPTVVVFGPTDESATGPAGHRNAILRAPVECAPCHERECPIDHRCMTRVTSERAVDAALELLK